MEKIFNIEGMSCQHCVKAVRLELEDANFSNFKVDVNSAKVQYDTPEEETKVVAAIEEAGFKVVSSNLFHSLITKS